MEATLHPKLVPATNSNIGFALINSSEGGIILGQDMSLNPALLLLEEQFTYRNPHTGVYHINWSELLHQYPTQTRAKIALIDSLIIPNYGSPALIQQMLRAQMPHQDDIGRRDLAVLPESNPLFLEAHVSSPEHEEPRRTYLTAMFYRVVEPEYHPD